MEGRTELRVGPGIHAWRLHYWYAYPEKPLDFPNDPATQRERRRENQRQAIFARKMRNKKGIK